jgi:hypothetical protein
MAYPASTQTLQTWLQEIDQVSNKLKKIAEGQFVTSQSGSLTADAIRKFFDLCVKANVFFTEVAAVPGIAAYLTAEKQDTVADPVAEFQAMQSEIVDTLDWIRANMPTGSFNSGNYLLSHTLPVGNTATSVALTFTVPQTDGYRTQLTNLIGTIS